MLDATQNFHISWDDNDSEGRIVAVADVALNKIPDLDQIGLGSHVLFQQGRGLKSTEKKTK